MTEINSYEEMLDTILSMVKATEPDEDLAIGATTTIASLMSKGEAELAMKVLATYKPKETPND